MLLKAIPLANRHSTLKSNAEPALHPPIILGMDTASREGLVVLQTAEGIIYAEKNTQAKEHNAFILPAIQNVLSQAKLTLSDIDYLACGVGPGSFVGTRLAVAVAQGLGYALKKPLIALSALDILAQAYQRQHPHNTLPLAIAVDAKMQGFYFSEFCLDKKTAQLIRNKPETFHRLNALSQNFRLEYESDNFVKVGSAWSLLGLPALENLSLDASDLLYLAKKTISHNKLIQQAQDLVPTYLNDEGNWKKSGSI